MERSDCWVKKFLIKKLVKKITEFKFRIKAPKGSGLNKSKKSPAVVPKNKAKCKFLADKKIVKDKIKLKGEKNFQLDIKLICKMTRKKIIKIFAMNLIHFIFCSLSANLRLRN